MGLADLVGVAGFVLAGFIALRDHRRTTAPVVTSWDALTVKGAAGVHLNRVTVHVYNMATDSVPISSLLLLTSSGRRPVPRDWPASPEADESRGPSVPHVLPGRGVASWFLDADDLRDAVIDGAVTLQLEYLSAPGWWSKAQPRKHEKTLTISLASGGGFLGPLA